MQFTGLTVRAWTIVIVEPEGDVARLLKFVDHHPATEGVHGAGWDRDHIARFHAVVDDGVLNSARIDRLSKTVRIHAIPQTASNPTSHGIDSPIVLK